MNFTLAIYRLNIMFRHMPVPRDTSVLREIIIVCCESVGNCQTLPKDGSLQIVNIYHISFFFSFLCVRWPSFPTSFCPDPTCAQLVFRGICLYIVTWFTCLYRSLYHVIFSHLTVFSVFFGKS